MCLSVCSSRATDGGIYVITHFLLYFERDVLPHAGAIGHFALFHFLHFCAMHVSEIHYTEGYRTSVVTTFVKRPMEFGPRVGTRRC